MIDIIITGKGNLDQIKKTLYSLNRDYAGRIIIFTQLENIKDEIELTLPYAEFIVLKEELENNVKQLQKGLAHIISPYMICVTEGDCFTSPIIIQKTEKAIRNNIELDLITFSTKDKKDKLLVESSLQNMVINTGFFEMLDLPFDKLNSLSEVAIFVEYICLVSGYNFIEVEDALTYITSTPYDYIKALNQMIIGINDEPDDFYNLFFHINFIKGYLKFLEIESDTEIKEKYIQEATTFYHAFGDKKILNENLVLNQYNILMKKYYNSDSYITNSIPKYTLFDFLSLF